MDQQFLKTYIESNLDEEPDETPLKVPNFYKTRIQQLNNQLSRWTPSISRRPQLQQLQPIVMDNIANEVVRRCGQPSSYLQYRRNKHFLPMESSSTHRTRTTLPSNKVYNNMIVSQSYGNQSVIESNKRLRSSDNKQQLIDRVMQVNRKTNNIVHSVDRVSNEYNLTQHQKMDLQFQMSLQQNGKNNAILRNIQDKYECLSQLQCEIHEGWDQIQKETQLVNKAYHGFDEYFKIIKEQEQIDTNVVQQIVKAKNRLKQWQHKDEFEEVQKYKEQDCTQLYAVMKYEQTKRTHSKKRGH